MENQLNRAKWWTVDRTFLLGMGFVMAAAFGSSLFAQQTPRTGSALVPSATLEKLIANGAACQTFTAEEGDNKFPPRQC
jgi:hypothetical protein